MDAVYEAIRDLSPDDEMSGMIRRQLYDFIGRVGRFSSKFARDDAKDPNVCVTKWWNFHGSHVPELQSVAIKILSQPISTSSAERVWSTYSFIHNVTRNRLNSHRADTLVYIHSNLRLLSRFNAAAYKEGPNRKWDINPELPLMDESSIRMEDMRWQDLDDDFLRPSTFRASSQSLLSSPSLTIRDLDDNDEAAGSGTPRVVSSSELEIGRPSNTQGRITSFLGRGERTRGENVEGRGEGRGRDDHAYSKGKRKA
ncbi:uncharacterized protein LOC143862361 [Tasmannia lanceolata]|uniref:uncharacterized protein LOC143862361 n=1 Tax=Tasmannia lanceolata TaxID=3420 RepID=UPI00406458C3